MVRFTLPAVTFLLLGGVCAAQSRPELMGPAQPPQHQKMVTPAQPSARPATTPVRQPMPSGAHAAAAASTAAGQTANGTPKALLPLRPPRVSYSNGMLGIVAENSTLADVLTAVRQKTGTNIDAPASAASERVVISIGPAPANSVLAALLNGSRFDYIILGSQ